MFAVSSPWSDTRHNHFFQPHRPSQSSPTHAAVPFFTSMTSTPINSDSPPATSKAERHKYAPAKPRQLVRLTSSPSRRRELRNAVLLKGVRDRRQNARDDLRGEYILRSDMLAEQRAWEQAQEIEAAKWSPREDQMDQQPDEALDDAELEYLLRREDEELQARAAEEEVQAMRRKQVDGFGSDDEDFDMLFLEAMQEFERSQESARGMDFS